jgi:hypothetical protein
MSISTISRILEIKIENEDPKIEISKPITLNTASLSARNNVEVEIVNGEPTFASKYINNNDESITSAVEQQLTLKWTRESNEINSSTDSKNKLTGTKTRVIVGCSHHVNRIYNLLNCTWASNRTKSLIVEYIIRISKGALSFVVSTKYDGDVALLYEEDCVVYIMELLVRLETGIVLNKNKLNFLTWLDSTSVRMRILAMIGLLTIVDKIPDKAYEVNGFISSIESKFHSILTNVPLVSSEQNNKTSFSGLLGKFGYGLLKRVEPSLLEPSGYPAREFFTILNTLPSEGHVYYASHLVHVNLFSIIYSWFLALYHPSHDNNESHVFLPLKMKLEMEDLIVRYCTRLLDQVAMPKASSYQEGTGLNDPRLQDDLHEAVTLEALRLLDLICQRNASIVTRLFPIVKRFAIDKFNAHIRRSNSRHSPIIFLTAIQFFVNHNEVTTMFDVDPIFRSYFHDYLRCCYRSSLVAFETIRFCIFNKRKLLTHTNMLFLYFPALLKLAAWHPRSFSNEFVELLPALISPPSCMELFHSILDLPLLASIMESSLENPHAQSRKQSINFDTTGPQKQFIVSNSKFQNKALAGNRRIFSKGNTHDVSFQSNKTANYYSASNDSTSTTRQIHNTHSNEYFVYGNKQNVHSVASNKNVNGKNVLGSDKRTNKENPYLDQLIKYMLRDESSSYGTSGPQKLQRKTAFDSLSGMDGCIWAATGMKTAVEKLCHRSNVTLRVHEVCLLVPILLNTYFDVMLVDAPEECACAMMRVIFSRFDMLYGPLQFQGRVRRVLLNRLLATFEKFPHFLMPMKHNIFHVVSDVNPESDCSELALHACWIIGEYANLNKGHTAMINDLFEALETIVYERLFILGGSNSNNNWVETENYNHMYVPYDAETKKSQFNYCNNNSLSTRSSSMKSKQLYPTRLMHVLVSTLTKLGACTSDLAPRAQLCLAKVISTRQGFHYSVRDRAKESVRLLKLSSVASKLFDYNGKGALEIEQEYSDPGLPSSLSFSL